MNEIERERMMTPSTLTGEFKIKFKWHENTEGKKYRERDIKRKKTPSSLTWKFKQNPRKRDRGRDIKREWTKEK